MWDGDFGVLPVLDGSKVVGMITDRDICMAAATKRRDPGTIRVKEVITGQVFCVFARHRYSGSAENHAKESGAAIAGHRCDRSQAGRHVFDQ